MADNQENQIASVRPPIAGIVSFILSVFAAGGVLAAILYSNNIINSVPSRLVVIDDMRLVIAGLIAAVCFLVNIIALITGIIGCSSRQGKRPLAFISVIISLSVIFIFTLMAITGYLRC